MPRVLHLLLLVFAATISPVLHAVDTEEQPGVGALDPDYAAGRKAIEARNWNAAIKSFSSAALRDPDNADLQNYLGFSYRKLGQLEPAFKHYQRTLALSYPRSPSLVRPFPINKNQVWIARRVTVAGREP